MDFDPNTGAGPLLRNRFYDRIRGLNRGSRSSNQSGFTIIEVMVAALILVVGLLAVTTLVNNANAVTDTTKAREGATNLARQLLEISRTLPYAQIDNTNLNPLLQAAGVSDDDPAAGWQVRRRNITYTVNTFACIFDSAKDGARTTAADQAATYCPGSATAGSSPVDQAPDDFRRVEIAVSWTLSGRTPNCNGQTTSSSSVNTSTGVACVTESELIPNPSGGLGPNIQSVTFDQSCCTMGTGTDANAIENDPANQLVFTVVTTSPADQVLWTADDGVSNGQATAVASDPTFKTWTFTYNFPTGQPLLDGPHTITVQAFLASVSGNPRPAIISLNRNVPPTPNTQFNSGANSIPAIGVNTRLSGNGVGAVPIIEINWHQVSDGDILGYRVYRETVPGSPPVLVGGSSDTPVCPGSGLTSSTTTSCTDTSEAGLTGLPQLVSYYVVAFDNRWTVRPNPTIYSPAPLPGQAQCPLLSGPLTLDDTSGPSSATFGATRPGCPSAVLTIDMNAAAQNPRPTWPNGNPCVTMGTQNGLPALTWPDASTVATNNPIQFYRVYRNPANPTQPQLSERYSQSSTLNFIDPKPSSGGGDTYVVTAVDSNWQESDPIQHC